MTAWSMERFALKNVVQTVAFPVHRFAPEDLMAFRSGPQIQ
jgi:hypothetical protein